VKFQYFQAFFRKIIEKASRMHGGENPHKFYRIKPRCLRVSEITRSGCVLRKSRVLSVGGFTVAQAPRFEISLVKPERHRDSTARRAQKYAFAHS